MTVTTPTLQETYGLLDKAIADINSKKKIVDDLQKEIDSQVEKLRIAANDYNMSITKARELKQQLHDTIESIIPTSTERVR